VIAIGLNVSAVCAESVKTLTFLDFEDGVLVSKGWGIGAYDGATVNISITPGLNLNGSRGSLRGLHQISENCGTKLVLIATITSRHVCQKILKHLGLPVDEVNAIAPRAPPDFHEEFTWYRKISYTF